MLPKNDTMQDIKFAPEDETWILGKCVPAKIKQNSLQVRTVKNLLIQLQSFPSIDTFYRGFSKDCNAATKRFNLRRIYKSR